MRDVVLWTTYQEKGEDGNGVGTPRQNNESVEDGSGRCPSLCSSNNCTDASSHVNAWLVFHEPGWGPDAAEPPSANLTKSAADLATSSNHSLSLIIMLEP